MTNAKVSVLFVALLIASSFGTASAGTAAGNETDAAQTFHVVQGDQRYEITPVGSGDRTVSEFYDYRAGAGTLYGSYGEESQAIQRNQVSHLFVYDGSEGLSLVILHDALNETEGGAASFYIEGLPENREWVVEDDDYSDRDDEFVHAETMSEMHWMWGDNRTDGAAVRGLDGEFEAIRIGARWGEDSWAHLNRSTPWPYATDDVDEWRLRSGTGEEFPLAKDESITIEKVDRSESGDDGTDGDDAESGDGSATLSVSAENVAIGESVTFDASGSVGACENATYHWDLDGDGERDRTTDTPTVSHDYDAAGSYDATVTVVHEDGSTDTSSTSVDVTSDDRSPECDPENDGETSE